ncbi:MAG: type I-B CRISPR-associated protein Cas8b1/Cst1, partial [Pseudothermotoga sp.]
MTDMIILYPKNWFYNAGVIGLLRVLSSEFRIDSWLKDDGSLVLDLNVFNKVCKGKLYIPNALICYVEYLTKDEDLEEWLSKTNSEKYKQFYNEMG